MSAAHTWLICGLLACGAELLLPGVFLLWIGLAALAVGLALLAVALPLAAQVALFVVLAGVSVWIGLGRRRGVPGADPNGPAADLVGQPCRAVAFSGTEGRVRFRDAEWAARADAGPVAPGDALRILGVEDGNRLLVAAAPDSAPALGVQRPAAPLR